MGRAPGLAPADPPDDGHGRAGLLQSTVQGVPPRDHPAAGLVHQRPGGQPRVAAALHLVGRPAGPPARGPVPPVRLPGLLQHEGRGRHLRGRGHAPGPARGADRRRRRRGPAVVPAGEVGGPAPPPDGPDGRQAAALRAGARRDRPHPPGPVRRRGASTATAALRRRADRTHDDSRAAGGEGRLRQYRRPAAAERLRIPRPATARPSGIDPHEVDPTAGHAGLADYDPTAHLHRLAEQVRGLDEDQRAVVASGDLSPLRGGAEFLERFGHVSDSGNDFSQVPWREDPARLAPLLLDGSTTSATGATGVATATNGGFGVDRALFRRAQRFRWSASASPTPTPGDTGCSGRRCWRSRAGWSIGARWTTPPTSSCSADRRWSRRCSVHSTGSASWSHTVARRWTAWPRWRCPR